MSRQEMPRVYELRDLITDPSNPCTYFQNFDDSICDESSKKQVWLAREREFQRLDRESWQFLTSEACPYLVTRDARRGWEQLISILNQARAHNYLTDEGCLEVHFIPRKNNGKETPDLEGTINGIQVLCEVKTINISDVEANRRQSRRVGSVKNSLDEGFFRKLMSDLCKAKSQIKSYEGKGRVRRVAFVVLNFDDFLGEYKRDYIRNIDLYLAANPVSCIDIVFYNQKTAFHCNVDMQNASVVNEPD